MKEQITFTRTVLKYLALVGNYFCSVVATLLTLTIIHLEINQIDNFRKLVLIFFLPLGCSSHLEELWLQFWHCLQRNAHSVFISYWRRLASVSSIQLLDFSFIYKFSAAGDVKYCEWIPSVLLRIFITVEGYRQYLRGCSVLLRSSTITVEGYHQYGGGCSVLLNPDRCMHEN